MSTEIILVGKDEACFPEIQEAYDASNLGLKYRNLDSETWSKEVTNKYSGESADLNMMQFCTYTYIMANEVAFHNVNEQFAFSQKMPDAVYESLVGIRDNMQICKLWFAEHYNDIYMTLID